MSNSVALLTVLLVNRINLHKNTLTHAGQAGGSILHSNQTVPSEKKNIIRIKTHFIAFVFIYDI